MFKFTLPWVLWLALLPFILSLILPRYRTESTQALKVPFFQALRSRFGKRTEKPATSFPEKLLAYVCWILLVIAAAGPVIISKPIPVPSEGRSLMMAIDLSGSMREQDMVSGGNVYSRFDVVKSVAGQFIKDRKGDRIGLILFGSQAYLRAPLTPDVNTVQRLLDNATPGLAGEQTAIGDSIALAIKQLRKSSVKNRVLMLMTDGQNNAGNVDPIKAAQMARQAHIKIYTIGLGSNRVSWAVQGPDNETLKKIASMTGGRFFYAGNVKQLKQVYNSLDRLESSQNKPHYYTTAEQLYAYPLGAAFTGSLLLALYSLIRRRLHGS